MKQKQANNKQSNLPTLTVSCDRTSCLIRSKKKKQKKDQEIGRDDDGNSNGNDNHNDNEQ